MIAEPLETAGTAEPPVGAREVPADFPRPLPPLAILSFRSPSSGSESTGLDKSVWVIGGKDGSAGKSVARSAFGAVGIDLLS